MAFSARHADLLPLALPPRVEAAAYIGVSPTKFDELVRDGRVPRPKRIDARTVRERKQLDPAFEALPDETERNARNEVAA